MITQLKSYRNGIHGEFFLSVAAELERLQSVEKESWIKVKCATHGNRTTGLCSACQKLERAEIERSYAHQLGELARLSDIVCGEVLSFSNTDLFPENVMTATNEIMEYVDAVRPGEGEKEVKWAMHIIGPDDVIPCVGEFDALRKANQHNKSFAKLMANDPSPNDPYCVAVAELV